MREEHYGVKGSHHGGVFFTEESVAGESVGQITVNINRQNGNLTSVKDKMAQEANTRGATCIANFRYGQRAHNWWEHLFTFRWDSESWFGEGEAIRK